MDDRKSANSDNSTEDTVKEQLAQSSASMRAALPEDPRSFMEAPFSYPMSQNEMVILNNGTLQYSVTDFVLPGRNGFDLIMTRRYNSDSAGLYDMNPVSVGWGRFSTGRRNNAHNNKMYGLGFGWYFVLPSIEVVPESEQDRINFIYPMHLHLEDGRNFEIEGNSLKGHPLLDVTVAQTTGSIVHPFRSDITRPYHTVVSYKNGNKDYFQRIVDNIGRLDSFQLVARQDNFGNTICFQLAGRNGMTIVDTWGRNIVLSASGNTMTWTMPDHTPTAPRRITYTISDAGGRRLVRVTDQLNRITEYEYHSLDIYRAVSRFASAAHGDTSNVEFPFLLLRRITHPTGALTEYEYGVMQSGAVNPIRLSINNLGGFRQYFPVRARKDISGGTDHYPVSYTYSLAANNEYIRQANTQKLFNVNEQHIFNDQGLLINMETRHSNALVFSSAYGYGSDSSREDYKLITSEDTKRHSVQTQSWYLQNLTQWQYTADKKANVTKIIETYPNDPALNQETNLLYGAHSILTEKNYKKDDAATIYIRYALRSSPDNKVVEFKRVFENNTLRERTQYIYGTTNNDRYCVTQERRFYTVGNASLESASTFFPVNYAYNSGRFTHAPIRMEIAGIVDADGVAAGSIVETFDYDAYGRMTSRTDGNNRTTNIAYDALGRAISETFPAINGRRDSRSVHYNDANNSITVTNENLFRERYEYTRLGQIERAFLAVGNTPNAWDTLLLEYTYDALGRLTTERTYDGNGTSPGNVKAAAVYEYDRFNRVTSKRIPAVNYIETHSYTDAHADPDEPGRRYFFHQKTVIGEGSAAPSLVTAEFLDQMGQVRKAFSGGARVATHGYDKIGNTISLLDARSIPTAWTYDYAGRTTSTTRWMNGRAQTSRTEYDALGNIRFSWNFTGRQTEFHHDAAGRLIRQVFPFDARRSTIKSYYDRAGNLTWRKVSQGEFWREIEHRYDARNRQTDVIQYTFKNPDNLTGARWLRTAFQYDGVGNTTEVRTGYTESSGNFSAVGYTYNRFGAALTITDAIGQVERFQYDNTGTLVSKTDRNGSRIDYRYDALNRPTRESVTVDNPNGQMTSEREISYARTGAILRGISREAEHGQPAHTLTMEYTYNNRGQLIRQTDPDSAVKEYTYDPNGSRETFRLLRNNAVSPEISLHYSYDDVNRLQRVRTGGSAGTVISEYDYDANGNRTAMRYPQGNMETVYSYNDANLIVSLENRRNGVRTSAWEYNFFLDGNPSSKIDRTNASRTIRYQYDRIGRLTQESDPDWNTIAYEYDQFSNRSRMTVSGSESYETTYEYQPNNLLVRESRKQDQAAETLFYRYDANGNQIYREWEKRSSAVTGPGRMDLRDEERADTPAIIDMREYDGFDRLVKVHRPPMSILYRYRPDGLRHGKAVVNPFSGAVHRTIHHWDGENIVLESVNEDVHARYLYGIDLIARQMGNSLFYYQFNMRGDVVQHTDAAYEYNAFGNERSSVLTDPNPFRYAGEYWDAETSTYYLRFRNYNPGNGRFTQPDPNWNTKNMQESTETIMQSGNLYVYTMNNPIMWSDPWGLWSSSSTSSGNTTRVTTTSPSGQVTVNYFDRATGNWLSGADSTGWFADSSGRSSNTYGRGSVQTDSSGVPIYAPGNGWQWDIMSRVYLSGHNAFGNPVGIQHTFIIIAVSPGHPLHGTEHFKNNPWVRLGWQFATIGGTAPFRDVWWMKESVINSPTDIDINTNNFKTLLYLGGIIGLSNRLFDAHNNFNENQRNVHYNLFPGGANFGLGHNSNSFAHGILLSVGLSPGNPPYTSPGWNRPIPAHYFQRP